MAGTRSSTSNGKRPSPPTTTSFTLKRSPSASTTAPPRKRGRPSKKAKELEQKAIEETMKDVPPPNGSNDGVIAGGNDEGKPQEGKLEEEEIPKESNEQQERSKKEEELQKRADAVRERELAVSKSEQEQKQGQVPGESDKSNRKPETEHQNGTQDNNGNGKHEGKNAFDEIKSDPADVKNSTDEEQKSKSSSLAQNNNSIIPDEHRSNLIPTSILEKGIIYFFFRSRVGITDPQGIDDIARSYIVLRPLPIGAKLGKGPLEDRGDARLLALPKKVLPKGGRDRFLVFVEKAGVSVKEITEQFAGSEYATKTSGTSNSPPATPFAEGVYAIITTGRESHLAYHITIPQELGPIQKELGVNIKGSYVVSCKNPEASGPANATLGTPAKYPEEVQKRFRGLRWMPLEPELLNYVNTQFLIIGEGVGNLGRSMQESKEDKENDERKKPEEEMEKLKEEDFERVEGLKEDDPVFADLGLSSKEYPHLQTTW